MKTRSFYTILALTFFFIGETFSQPVVYPLHTGDRWLYYNYELFNDSMYNFISGDTIMPNSKIYFIFNDFSDVAYQRQSNDTVYIYNRFMNREEIFLIFLYEEGRLVSSYITNEDTIDITLLDTTAYMVYGVERRSWRFLKDYRRYVDDEIVFTVQDSLGIVSFSGFGFDYRLRGAIINGKVYGTITDVQESPQLIPAQFVLNQNYPNPFNPSTVIRYQLSVQNFVTLKVYNLLGQEVALLVNEMRSPGEYSVQFDASGIPSGMYIYRLYVDSRSSNSQQSYTFAKKMLLTK